MNWAMRAAGSGSVNPSIHLCAKSAMQRGKALTCVKSPSATPFYVEVVPPEIVL